MKNMLPKDPKIKMKTPSRSKISITDCTTSNSSTVVPL